jgi:hypothetical protein
MSKEILSQVEYLSEPCMVRMDSDWQPNSCWQVSQLLQTYENTLFEVGNYTERPKFLKMSLGSYFRYIQQQRDESPLYVFERCLEKCPRLLNGYSVPSYVDQDVLELLGKDRPPFRWVIIGPDRSGASWHTDPVGTSAWNTLIQGRKRWALYPPSKVPPGLRKSMSSLKWFLTIYPQLSEIERPIEIIQYPGDTIIVPSGWWHCVLNLDNVNIAVTQNWTSSVTFIECLESMREEKPALGLTLEKKAQVVPALAALLQNQDGKQNTSIDLDFVQNLILFLWQKQVNEDDLVISPSENLVVYDSELEMYLKVFANPDDYEKELLAYNRISGLQQDIFPELVKDGIYQGKPFLVSKRCITDGEYALPMHLVYNTKFVDMETTVMQLARVFQQLHHLPPLKDLAGKDTFSSQLHIWKSKYLSRQSKWAYLTPGLLEDSISIVNRFFETPVRLLDGVLHGDATSGNILGVYAVLDRIRFLPTHLIDFADSHHKQFDPLWDIACLFYTVMECNSSLLALFLHVYGTMWTETTIRNRLMGYLLLSPSKALVREMVRVLLKRGLFIHTFTWSKLEDVLFGSFRS